MKRVKISHRTVYIIFILISLIVTFATLLVSRFMNNTDGLYLKNDWTCEFREKVYVNLTERGRHADRIAKIHNLEK